MQQILTTISSGVVAATLLVCSLAVHAQSADDTAAACNEAANLIEQADYDGALEEAEWCVEGLRQLKQQRTLTVFPEAVDGFVGGELDNQSAMGMTIIEREYRSDSGVVTVSLTGGIAGGGLAALAQFATGMGAAGGQKMRIQKRTVIDMSGDNGGDAEYMVQLRSGGMLMISSSDLDSEELLAFVREFPIEELDDSLAR